MKKFWGYSRSFLVRKHFGIPNFFDLAVISFLIILPVYRFRTYSTEMMKGILLVYVPIGLLCLSLGMKERRQYNSTPLMVLTFCSMVHVFWHSFHGLKLKDGFFDFWLSWSLLNEGFIYMVFGCYFIYAIVRNAKEWGWYYIPIVAWLINHVRLSMIDDWSMTPILAVCGSGAIFLLLKFKNKWLSLAAVGSGLGIAIYKWDYLWGIKWISRPDFWKGVISRIKLEPLGYGFYHTLNTMIGLVAPEHKGFEYVIDRWGRGWRQNDLLEFGEYMGVVAVLVLLWFIVDLLWKSRLGLAFFLVVVSLLMCFFQRTMYFPAKAGLIQVSVALLILEKYALD